MTQKSYHTKATRQTNQEVSKQHIDAMGAVMEEVLAMLSNRSADYDNLRMFIERMPFGDTSWATMIFIKADRLCSSLAPDIPDIDEARVDDSLIDLIVYAIAYRAWRTIVQEEKAEDEARIHEKYYSNVNSQSIIDTLRGNPPVFIETVNNSTTVIDSSQSAGEAAARSLIGKARRSYPGQPQPWSQTAPKIEE